MKIRITITSVVIAAFTTMATVSCSSDKETAIPADAVAVVGDEVLSASEVRAALPAGLTPDDSISFAHAFVRNWVDRKLIAEVASADVDMSEIERLTVEYREELIMNAYRREMVRRADNTQFTVDSLRAYYDSHNSEFVLRRPMVKGVYLKIPEGAEKLSEMRRLYRSTRPTDIDKLEKAATGAIHYDYFRDRWVDWEQIENRIPVDFEEGVDAFLRSDRPLDINSGGYVYLLSVSEVLPAGAIMPFEAAMPTIRDRLLNSLRRRYDTQLRTELEERAQRDGYLSYPNGNPFE